MTDTAQSTQPGVPSFGGIQLSAGSFLTREGRRMVAIHVTGGQACLSVEGARLFARHINDWADFSEKHQGGPMVSRFADVLMSYFTHKKTYKPGDIQWRVAGEDDKGNVSFEHKPPAATKAAPKAARKKARPVAKAT